MCMYGAREPTPISDGTWKSGRSSPVPTFADLLFVYIAPAWQPGGMQLAYLTTHGAHNTDLWVGNALWARDAIGRPAWSPDGSALAFQRDNGIYAATGPGAEQRVASAGSTGMGRSVERPIRASLPGVPRQANPVFGTISACQVTFGPTPGLKQRC